MPSQPASTVMPDDEAIARAICAKVCKKQCGEAFDPDTMVFAHIPKTGPKGCTIVPTEPAVPLWWLFLEEAHAAETALKTNHEAG
jgi:hypothetical protein